MDVRKFAWAVEKAAILVPNASCLTQSLTLQIMLARHDVPSTLIIGVSQSDEKKFEAHAWLEIDDSILLGGTAKSLSRYARLAEFGPTGQ